MAVIITHPPQEIGGSSQNKRNQYKRLMRVEGDSLIEIMNSTLVPMDNSRHPDDSRYILKSRDFQIVGNVNRRVQCQVELSYEKGTFSGWGNFAEDTGDKDPWKLGAFNVSISSVSESAPFVKGYDSNGTARDVVNTAGSRLVTETQRYLTQISFSFCVDANKTTSPPVNRSPSINAGVENVIGYRFPAFTGLLQPMNAELVVEYGDGGKVSRRYWQISATILYNPQTHKKETLNVGTMAKFARPGSTQIDDIPKPIYQYTPWDSTQTEVNMMKRPQFGSIDHVIAAKIKYAKLFPANQYKERFDELPWHEMTEPLPLNMDGTIDTGALLGGAQYKKLAWFETCPESWARYMLPATRQ